MEKEIPRFSDTPPTAPRGRATLPASRAGAVAPPQLGRPEAERGQEGPGGGGVTWGRHAASH